MCLIVFDWQPEPRRLILAANRDEFFARPALPLTWWPDAPHVLAGRDLQGGGTWLGLHPDGRFAALTNFRAPAEKALGGPSRGELVADFLRGPRQAPLAYLTQMAQDQASAAEPMRGYNLLAGNLADGELAYYSNRADAPPRLLTPGCYGLSNALLDTPWPKVEAKKADLRALLARTGANLGTDCGNHLAKKRGTGTATGADPVPLDALLALMQDSRTAPDAALPSTGLSLERERALSAAYIALPDYGTRCITALSCANGVVEIVERGDSTPDGERDAAHPRYSRQRYAFVRD